MAITTQTTVASSTHRLVDSLRSKYKDVEETATAGYGPPTVSSDKSLSEAKILLPTTIVAHADRCSFIIVSKYGSFCNGIKAASNVSLTREDTSTEHLRLPFPVADGSA